MDKDYGLKYYDELSLIEKALYQQKCYAFLRDLNWQYPHFQEWYFSLFDENDSLKKGREIIFCEFLNQIAGIIILKRNIEEKKICTLRVAKPFQGMGIATELIKAGNEWLDCDRPLITVNRKLKPQYEGIFKYFGFEEEEKRWGYYSIFSSEYAYNGLLGPKPILVDTVEFTHFGNLVKKITKNGGKASYEEARWAIHVIDYICPYMVQMENEAIPYDKYSFAN